jgi:hypothetical protein
LITAQGERRRCFTQGRGVLIAVDATTWPSTTGADLGVDTKVTENRILGPATRTDPRAGVERRIRPQHNVGARGGLSREKGSNRSTSLVIPSLPLHHRLVKCVGGITFGRPGLG